MNAAQEVLRPRAAALRMTRIVDVPAWFVAALLAAAYLIIDPPSADLAAQVYRSDFFAHHGFALWDDSWYGGHHMPGYSVLFPPLGAALGAAAWWLTSRRGPALELGASALVPAVALMTAFPEGGVEPFVASAFWEAMFLIGAVLVALPREERELRAGVLLYAAATVASYA